MRSAVLSYLGWLAFVGAALILAFSDRVPVIPGYVRPANLFHYFVYAELFYVLVLWPPSIPRSVSVRAPILQVVLMILFVLPFALLCRNVPEIGLRTLFLGQLLVIATASFVAVLFSRGWKIAPWYYLGFWIAAAGIPFAYYLALEFYGASPGFLAVLSPFWAASQLESGSTAWVLCSLLGGGTVALILATYPRMAKT